MGLELKKSFTRKDDGSVAYLEFREATGNYDAADNDTGFGVETIERNTLAILVYVLHEKSTGAEELIPYQNDPLTVTAFTFDLTGRDGVWHHWLFAVPIFDPLAIYTLGDIVYDNENPSNPFVKKYNGTTFDVIPLSSLINETSLIQLESYEPPIPQTSDFVNDTRYAQLEQLRKVRLGLCEPDDWQEKNMQFVHARDTTESAINLFCAQLYSQAQLEIEEVLKLKSEIQ